jgi:hypothetical protein
VVVPVVVPVPVAALEEQVLAEVLAEEAESSRCA